MSQRPCLPADWPAPPGVQAFTTMRYGAGCSQPPFDAFNLGNRYAADGDAPDVVDANRRELVERFGLPSTPHWLRQVHGTSVVHVDGPGLQHEPEADAAVTASADTVLAILTADCLPVLLCSLDGREVAGAHAGWRGLVDGVLEQTVGAMRTSPDRVLAWLGPAAGPGEYEIGLEVYDAFVSRDWSCGDAFCSTRPLHWRVDLYALARRRLQAAGVPAAQIHGGGLSTIADSQRFFSHRRDRRTGRMASVIWTTAR